MKKSQLDRFMEKVQITEGCWLWTGAKTGAGYGQFWTGRKVIRAHWFLLDRQPKSGQVACHKCDNPSCVNPSHVFVGTQADNMRDASDKKRWKGWTSEARRKAAARGERSSRATITDRLAAVIKAVPKEYGLASVITRHLHLDGMVVGNIWNGRHWQHIKITEEAKREARRLLRDIGWAVKENG